MQHEPPLNLQDRMLWVVVALFVAGAVARRLLDDSPFNPRKFLGEIILSCLTALVFYAFGVLEGLSPLQLVLAGGLGSLGSVRVLEWILKIGALLKKVD